MIKRKNLKVLTGLLTATMLLGNTMTAFAKDIEVSADKAKDFATTTFSADADAIGGGLVVTIPASLDLTADAGSGNFVANDVVSAKGNIDPCKAVTVSADKNITYSNSDKDSITVNGIVTFGTDGVEKWTAEQTKASLETLDERNVSVTVPKENVEYIDTYKTEVYFNATPKAVMLLR